MDNMLTTAVKFHGGKNWKKIATCFKNKTDVQCLPCWKKVLNPKLVKGPWTKHVPNNDLIDPSLMPTVMQIKYLDLLVTQKPLQETDQIGLSQNLVLLDSRANYN
ncbi:hypothetical protein MKX01_036282 [Papaver californicum]|nr:hypothetical protein MKX01_036282 [Papaver californicum]